MRSDAPIDALERLIAAGPAIPTDAWSLRDPPLRAALAAVDAGARTLVECGSGRSTVILARRLAELGEGTIHSLEHDPAWAEHTRELIEAEGLKRAHVITAPLEPHPLAGDGPGWYRADAVVALPLRIELLLVDGPPAGDPALHHSRRPALYELAERLAPGATIILDDASRPGEQLAITEWSTRFELEFTSDADFLFATAVWPVYVARNFEVRKLHRLE